MKDNSNLKTLDIRNNPIQDGQYKTLFGLLQNNKSIQTIEYTLYDEENIKRLEKFKFYQDEGLDFLMISAKLKHDDEHHHHIPFWQKLCFPIWCWKSLIHDKHEAFRFKYDTDAIKKVEENVMPGVKRQLYYWTLIYYFITFVAPYIFIEHECEKTFDYKLFVMYGIYLVGTAIWELYVVFKI